MSNSLMVDVDPLSSYEAQYDYPLPNAHYYQHAPHPASYTYRDDQPQNYPQAPYQPTLPEPEDTNYISNTSENITNDQTNPTSNNIEEDIKPDIVPKEPEKKLTKKTRAKNSNYWNKKITEKDFAFYGCSVCNIAYTDLQKLDQHVVIHSNRLTSYDLRLINLKKRKRLKKAKKRQKKNSKIKKECEIEIKPEDGYIGTEKASEFNGDDKSGIKHKEENNENNPVNSKRENEQNHINVYKCFGCNKQFALSYYLRIHVRSHTDEKPYTCSECGQCFITASKLGRHNKRIHLAVRHQCRICYKIFSRFELLVKHFDSKHSDDKLDGEPYGKVFIPTAQKEDYNAILPYLKELEEQLKQENEKKPKTEDPWFPAAGCAPGAEPGGQGTVAKVTQEEVFISKQEDKVALPTNIEFYDENKDTQMPATNIIMEDVKIDFVKQEVDNDDDNDHGIGDDNGGIGDGDHFGDHGFQDSDDGIKEEDPGSDEEYVPSQTWVRSHSPLTKTRRRKRDQTTSCPVCNKSFNKKSNLDVHMRSHTGEKPFPCTICGRAYSTSVSLKRHSALHDKNKLSKDDVKPKTEPEIEITAKGVEDLSKTDNTKDDPASDEEYFPSQTWARPPSPLPPPPELAPRRNKTTCKICNKQLCSKTYLAVHMRTHTGEKPFSCYICGRGFITASKMHRHVLTHDESWEGKDRIKPEDDAKVKLETETEGNENSQEKPDKELMEKAKTRLLLKKSKKTFFEKKGKECKKWTHVCEFCNQKFLHLETLQVHKKCHDESENMKCYYCLEPHTDRDALKMHEATHVGPRPYLCTTCGHHYTKRGPMIYHRKKCKGQEEANESKKYLCEYCNKGYSTHSKLQRHLASHSVSRVSLRYECPVCAHMFHTRYHVQMHLRSHIKEGLILEENRNSVLAMVLQNARKIPKPSDVTPPAAIPGTAGDERSRICNICGQIFQHFYYLEEHLKTHGAALGILDLDEEEEKKHTCQVCSKSFKLPYYLKLHSYTHTKEKPFICQQCGKGFITKGKLKRHLETHQGLKKYQCHICYKFFTRPSYLRIHVRTIHGTQDYNFRDYGIGVPIGALSHD